jgi:hypothetical protein
MEENPYQSTSSHTAELQTVVPHSTSVRGEAWRGFKFGARITGIVMFAIVAVMGLVTLGVAIYLAVVTKGEILNAVSYFQIAKGIGGSIFAVLLMSFYGGIAGGIIMTIAALIRKRRNRNVGSKVA